jgi:hypothetical protein
MVNRVLLGEDGSDFVLKVSKAGTNVLTASDQDLLFDSTKIASSLVIKSGTVSVTTGSSVIGQTPMGSSSWVNYGQTLSYYPLVLITRQVGSSQLRNAPEVHTISGLDSSKNSFTRITIQNYVEVQSSRFRVHILASQGNVSTVPNQIIANSSYTFDYIVFAIGGETSS